MKKTRSNCHCLVFKIKSNQLDYGSTIELCSRQCLKPGEHPYYRDLPYHLIVKRTLTWFRRIQNLIDGFQIDGLIIRFSVNILVFIIHFFHNIFFRFFAEGIRNKRGQGAYNFRIFRHQIFNA